MRPSDIENWALTVLDRIVRGQPVEDSRVELKAKWPEDTKKAARRIAAHANAAHGEAILWLIGIDEKSAVSPGVDYSELSNWRSAINASFDELAPEMHCVNVPFNGVTIAALLFETDRAPYVVKVSDGGAIQREIPWRDATGVKTATRSQLLRLLSPLQKRPEMELAAALLSIEPWNDTSGRLFLGCNAKLALFLTQPSGQETVIPSHRSKIRFISSGHELGPFSNVEFRSVGEGNVLISPKVATIVGSGLFEATAIINQRWEQGKNPFPACAEMRIQLALEAAHSDSPIIVDAIMPQQSNDTACSVWRTGLYKFR